MQSRPISTGGFPDQEDIDPHFAIPNAEDSKVVQLRLQYLSQPEKLVCLIGIGQVVEKWRYRHLLDPPPGAPVRRCGIARGRKSARAFDVPDKNIEWHIRFARIFQPLAGGP
jgi:hypothetical protein